MATNAEPVKGRGYVLYGFAIGFGALLAVLAIVQVRFPLLAIPLIAYILAVLLNLLTQKTVCKKTNVSQAFVLSAISAVLALLIYLAATYIRAVGSPIRSLMPNSDALTQQRFIQGFYLFWAGLYGQIVSGGFMQTCS